MNPSHLIAGAAVSLVMALGCPSARPHAWAADQVLLQDAGRAARAAASSGGLQTEFPAARISQERQAPPPQAGSPSLDPAVMRVILWIAIIIIAVITLMNLKRNLWSSSRSRRFNLGDEEDATPAATAGRMEKAQSAADDLAHSGSFAQAMHTLLLQSVNELRRRLDVFFADSLTSREILQCIQVAPEARAAFTDIITRVEISYFGEREPGREEYEACRRSYERLSALLRNAAARESTA